MGTPSRWGAQTDLALTNFAVSGRHLDVRVVHALALIKRHAALVNARLGVHGVDEAMAAAIESAAAAVEAGDLDDQFPVDVYQTGSGTSTNMNVNEVLASLAAEALGRPVHPNDHVNASQSSNDVVPSAIRIAVAVAIRDQLRPAVAGLAEHLGALADRASGAVKAGRTHLMDATPVLVADEALAWARLVELTLSGLDAAVDRLCELPLGGSAVGTGVNVPDGFAAAVVAGLAADTRLPLRPAPDVAGRMAHMGGQGALSGASAAVREVAVALTKVANDLRLLGSGPATGLAELRLPELQAGSSIMPGKVNPVLCESANQVAARVFGNDATVAFAASQGILQLNTYLPVMADALLESVTLLANVVRLLAERVVAGIEVDVARVEGYAARTPSVATGLNLLVGYDVAAAIVKESVATGRPIREIAALRTDLAPDQLDAVLDPRRLASP